MQSRIVLVSDEQDFFEYMIPKLNLRKFDEIFKYNFNDIVPCLHLLKDAVLLVNSENSEQKTLDLLNLVTTAPTIIFSYNENSDLKAKFYKYGAIAYITLMTPDNELQGILVPALNSASLLTKSNRYRELLVKNNLINRNNEVYLDYAVILDKELEIIKKNSEQAVFVAISPNEKSRFLLTANQIETIILKNIRKNDILMNYAINKYFLLLRDTDVSTAQKIWEKIRTTIPEKIYAGFVQILSKTREQIINEALNKLHEAINYNKDYVGEEKKYETGIENFKLYRKEFNKKMENVITPVFYHIKQKYDNKIFSTSLDVSNNDSESIFIIKNRYNSTNFKITTPGFAIINVDIVYYTNGEEVDSKRISFEPNEFEAGILEDLLEQCIAEYKEKIENDNNQY